MSTSYSLVRAAPKRLKLSSSFPIPSIYSAGHAPIYTPSRKGSHSQVAVDSGLRALPDVWFTGSSPHLNVPPRESQNQNPGKPPDERTLKLGKSNAHPQPTSLRNTQLNKAPAQLSASSKNAFPPFCNRHCRKKSSPRK